MLHGATFRYPPLKLGLSPAKIGLALNSKRKTLSAGQFVNLSI